MKKLRLFLLTLVALVGGLSASATKTVYVDPVGNSSWMADNPAISLYVFGDGDGWATSTDLSDGVIKFTFDDKFTKMIIVRGSKANANSFDNKWNQTGNIEDIQLNKLYKANGYNGDDLAYTVEDYTEPVPDTSYKVDFNTAITTSDHAFQVASNWRHIVDTYEDYWGDPSYASYSYSTTAGVDGSGALSCSTNQSSNSLYDLLVTPVVKGTVTIAAKTTASYYTPQLSFYKITDNGDGTYTRGAQITVDVSAINATDYTTITIPVDEAGERIGIRSSYVWLDNFSATEATVVPEAKMTIASAVPTATTGTIYWEQQPNGKVLVSYTVTVTNTGEVDLTQGDEGFSVSIINRTTGDVYATVAVPQNLAIGETSDEFVVSAEVETSLWPNSYTYINMDLKENIFGTTVQRAQSHYKAYESKFVFREAGSTASSSISSAQNWGTITESTSKNFEVANTGTAPLTITDYSAPEGFTLTPGFNPMSMPEGVSVSGTSVILQGGAVLPFTVTQDASATGTYSGTLTIVYQAYNAENTTNYTLGFSATVIGENTWTADFNNSTSTISYPAGAIAEGGINSDYQYISSGNYNNWIIGRNGGSYDTTNNKFITPKLHAAVGDKLAFDVKVGYSSSDAYFVKVYVSTDRVNWGEPVETYVYSNVGSSFTTKTISFDAEGDYYVAFAIYGTGSGIDNLVGLEKVAVAHDLYIKNVNWPDASIKSGSSQTKPSVDIIPLTDEVADNYTVKYIYGDNVVNIESKALTASASSTTSFTASFTPEVTTTTTFPGTKVVFEFTDGTKFETEEFDLTVTNEPIFHFLSSKHTSRWYEPTSDYTTPVNFGKTNVAGSSKTFYVLNWGSAALNVKSIVVPEGFTVSATSMNIPAFDGTQDGLETCQQALNITFSATEAGSYSGNMVITYVNGAGEDATFELALSGTMLDITKFYVNFDDQQWPAGSVYQSNVSISYISTGNYGLLSSSSTNNLFITPKLTVAANDILQFDASTRNSYYDGTVKVFISADREDFGDAVKEVELSKADNTAMSTYEYQFTSAGEYYVAFALEEARVDDIYGLQVAEVAHDWTIASSNIPTEAMQNYSSTATVNILNLGLQNEAAEDITVTAYVNNVAVATAEGVAIPMSHKLSDAGTQLSVSFMSTVAGTFPVCVEVKAGDYSVTTDPVEVVFAEEEVKTEADIAVNGTTGEVPLYLNYKNSESVTMYNAEALANAGISAGSKIKKITYKGYKTTDEQTTSFQVYYKWTDEQTLAQPATTYPYAAADNGMTMLIDEDHTWAKVGSSSEMGDMIVLDFTENPLTYESGKSLVIYMHSYVDGYKAAYFEKSTLSQDYCYTRRQDAATLSNAFSKAVPAAIHFTLDATVATLAGTVKTSGREAIANATITLKAENGVEYSGTTDEMGAYSINVIQAGLDFTATVEAENYLKKEFAYSLGGESKTLNVTLYKSFGVVGTFPGFDWDNDKVMTQSTEDPNIFTLFVPDVELTAGTTYKFKVRADGIWKADNNDGYELPNSGDEEWTINTTGTYNLKFTANVSEHTLSFELPFTLSETADGIADLNWVTIDVEREFKAGWNAVVLPFGVDNDEFVAAFGENSEVAVYDGDSNNNGNVTVRFKKQSNDYKWIEAGVPYLIWLENPVSGLKFTKNISSTLTTVEGTTFDFVGTYSSITANAGDYFVQGGQFVKATENNTVKPFRSYLKLKVAGVRNVSFMIGDDMTTEIEGLTVERDYTNDAIYNLNGQKVQQPTQRGLYIINGKKVMVK